MNDIKKSNMNFYIETFDIDKSIQKCVCLRERGGKRVRGVKRIVIINIQ